MTIGTPEQHPKRLITMKDDEPTTTSLQVAEAFGRRHANIMRAIKALDCSQEFTELNYEFSEYQDDSGRSLTMCRMTKNGFMFLVMGFRGTDATAIKERYITAFDDMADLLYSGIWMPGATGQYLVESRKVSAAARRMRQWQSTGPVLRRRALLEQAGQQPLL